MSALRRRVHRNLTREGRLSGHKGGKRLSQILATDGRESYPTKARRFARFVYQRNHLRAAGVRVPDGTMVGDGGPLGVTS